MREMYFLTTGSDYGIYCHLLYRMTLWPDYYLMVDIVAGGICGKGTTACRPCSKN